MHQEILTYMYNVYAIYKFVFCLGGCEPKKLHIMLSLTCYPFISLEPNVFLAFTFSWA